MADDSTNVYLNGKTRSTPPVAAMPTTAQRDTGLSFEVELNRLRAGTKAPAVTADIGLANQMKFFLSGSSNSPTLIRAQSTSVFPFIKLCGRFLASTGSHKCGAAGLTGAAKGRAPLTLS